MADGLRDLLRPEDQPLPPTIRTSCPALDAVLGLTFPLLDKGFVRVIDYMGDDAAVVQAARVSYGAGTKKVSEDAALIRYLMRHEHETPNEMCLLKLHIKAPIFVARQWMRHRTSFNEMSARYSVMADEFYVPAESEVRRQSSSNGQGSSGSVPSGIREGFVIGLNRRCADAYEDYESYIDAGVARETARILLPVNLYTQFYWTVNLRSLLHFLRLRADPHAQYEIRVYADLLEKIVQAWVPVTYAAYADYRKNALTISAQAVAIVARALCGEDVSKPADMSEREWQDLARALPLYGASF